MDKDDKDKSAQLKTDGDKVKKDLQSQGVMDIKAQIKAQILATVNKQGKVLCHWRMQKHSGINLPFLFITTVARAFNVDSEKVCEVLAEMIEHRDINVQTDLARPVTAEVLDEANNNWTAALSGQKGIDGRLILLSKDFTSVKNVSPVTPEELIAILNS